MIINYSNFKVTVDQLAEMLADTDSYTLNELGLVLAQKNSLKADRLATSIGIGLREQDDLVDQEYA
jgi:hypothetical protein